VQKHNNSRYRVNLIVFVHPKLEMDECETRMDNLSVATQLLWHNKVQPVHARGIEESSLFGTISKKECQI
jgi:hypothetical protein